MNWNDLQPGDLFIAEFTDYLQRRLSTIHIVIHKSEQTIKFFTITSDVLKGVRQCRQTFWELQKAFFCYQLLNTNSVIRNGEFLFNRGKIVNKENKI